MIPGIVRWRGPQITRIQRVGMGRKDGRVGLILPSPENGLGVAMSSSLLEKLWNGDEDVATPSFALGRALGRRRGCRHPVLRVGKGFGTATGMSPPRPSHREGIWNGDGDVATPSFALGRALGRRRGCRHPVLRVGKGFGTATRTSPPRSSRWEGIWNGDEDVATPFRVKAVVACAWVLWLET